MEKRKFKLLEVVSKPPFRPNLCVGACDSILEILNVFLRLNRMLRLDLEPEKKKRCASEANGREQAYNAGKTVAKTWIKNSSYQEIKDALHHQTAKRNANSFGSKSHIYFTSIEKVCPKEAPKFKWVYNDSFMNG